MKVMLPILKMDKMNHVQRNEQLILQDLTEQEKIQLERNKVNQTFIPTSTLTELSILKHAGKKKDLRGRNQSLPPQLRT